MWSIVLDKLTPIKTLAIRSFCWNPHQTQLKPWVCSNIFTTIPYSMPEKDSVRPSTWYLKWNMPKIHGCPTTSGRILQFANHHVFLTILTHISSTQEMWVICLAFLSCGCLLHQECVKRSKVNHFVSLILSAYWFSTFSFIFVLLQIGYTVKMFVNSAPVLVVKYTFILIIVLHPYFTHRV